MFVLLATIITGICAFVCYVKWRQSYWQRKGVACIPPEFYVGNVRLQITGKKSISEGHLERYKKLKQLDAMHGGMYFFLEPLYIPLDPDLVKQILTRDFQYFMGHGIYHHPKDILSMNLFNLEGEQWKQLRAKLTPTFTSGKMKMMFDTLQEKTSGLLDVVGQYCTNQEPVAIKDVLARFTTDIIGSCAFGIECNSLQDPENDFRVYGRKIFSINKLRLLVLGLIPWKILGPLGFSPSNKNVSDFFIKVVRETIRQREASGIYRKDFMQLLLQLKNDSSEQSVKLSENELIAQCFVFFLAGFETSSSTMTFALLELAMNPDLQEKLRKEIIGKVGDKELTYSDVMNMPYLDKVINETLRKYPPVSSLPRVCSKTYKVPNTDVILEKGTRVMIPVWALQKDPEYYPNPEVFDPERFSDVNKTTRPDFTYLPFGEGPRMCLGMRFGLMQTKVGLISLLRKFQFSLNKKTSLPIEMSPTSFVLSVKGEVWLDVV